MTDGPAFEAPQELDKVVMSREQFVFPEDTDGLLVVSPVGVGEADDYTHLQLFTNPDYRGRGSMSFLVSCRPGENSYEVLDLSNLPNGVEVEVVVRALGWEQNTTFRGREGNIVGTAVEPSVGFDRDATEGGSLA